MKTVRDILREADPLRHEPQLTDAGARSDAAQRRRGRVRPTVASSRWFRAPVALLATIAVDRARVRGGRVATWPHGSATVQAAVRFEVRLAEDQPAAGLREAQVTGSDRQSTCTRNRRHQRRHRAKLSSCQAAARRDSTSACSSMRRARKRCGGRPRATSAADGDTDRRRSRHGSGAPGPISGSALISGDYSQAEAERIVNGIGVR